MDLLCSKLQNKEFCSNLYTTCIQINTAQMCSSTPNVMPKLYFENLYCLSITSTSRLSSSNRTDIILTIYPHYLIHIRLKYKATLKRKNDIKDDQSTLLWELSLNACLIKLKDWLIIAEMVIESA